MARGRAEREAVPRSSHADFTAAADRPDPIGLLEEQAESRIAELVPIRYGRMLVSPFAFYRGGAAIMASDLAALPHTALVTQLCGDGHASNFGVFGLLTDSHEAASLPPAHLTPRQAEVLRLLEQGRSTKQIAQELHLSTETVRNHIRHVFAALGAHSRLEAVAIAHREGLLSDG